MPYKLIPEPKKVQMFEGEVGFLSSVHTENTEWDLYIDAFADSSLNINIVYYTKEIALAPHLKIKEALNLNIMAIVEEEGCSFAFPTQTLHIQKD